MKKNPFLILILLLFSFVTNVTAVNAPEADELTIEMEGFNLKFFSGHPGTISPVVKYNGEVITYGFDYCIYSYNSFMARWELDNSYTSLSGFSTAVQKLTGDAKYQIKVRKGSLTYSAPIEFQVLKEDVFQNVGFSRIEQTVELKSIYADLPLSGQVKDNDGNVIITLKENKITVAANTPAKGYIMSVMQEGIAKKVANLNIDVCPWEIVDNVGNISYSSLVHVMGNDISINLLCDYDGYEQLTTQSRSIILNLGGYNLSGTYTFDVRPGGTLTINGDNDKTNLTANFILNDNSSLTINGGRYITDEDYCINIPNNKAKVTLNGGIFKGAKAATNNIYNCLNKTAGNETTFYLYEDGVKYAVGLLGDDGKEVFVEKCKTMPFKVDYYFKKHPLGDYDNFTEYSGTKYFVTLEDATTYTLYDDEFNYVYEGAPQCDLNATITLLDNYKSFAQTDIPLGDNGSFTNITIDLKSSGCIMNAKYNIQGGARRSGMGGGSRLTIIGDDNKTNIEGSISTSGTNSMLTIYGGYYHNSDENFAVCVRNNGKANIYGGKFEATKTGSAGIMLTESNIVNIYGGRFLGDYYGMYIKKQPTLADSKTTINGGYFKGTTGNGSVGLSIEDRDATTSYPTIVNFGEFHGSMVAIANKNDYSKGSNSFYYQLFGEEGKETETLRENAELSSAGNLVYNSHSIIHDVRIHKDVTPYVIPWVNEEEFEYISDIHGRWYADNNNAASTATNTKLTFMYDGYMPDENAWVVPEYKKGTTPSDPGWVGTRCENVSTVVFDESFKKYKPTSCYKWFFGFQSLIELEGIKEECNLNTENVISMSNMFYGCYKLNSLDLSTLNTEQVESMALMFFNCEKLENLKMGSTKNVQSFYNMFGYCNNLIGLDLSSFNTESATTMERMFGDCKLLKVVKFGKDFKPATNIGSMFYRCPALETIIVFGETWQSSYFNDVEVFTMCDKLVGGNGTKYKSTNKNNPDFFHIDGNNDIPGYLTKLPYTIKYVEDDKEVNYEGLPTEYNPYDANISFFANNSSTPIELTAPPSKEGYHFVGWSDVLNTGIKDVTETVKIDPSVDRFNRIYKANWEKTYSVTLPAHMVMVKDDGVYNTVIQPETDGKYYFTSGEDAVFKVPDGYRFLPSTGYQCYTATEMKKEPNERSQYGKTGNVINTNNVFGATLQNDDLVVLAEIRKIVDITVETPFEYVYGSFTDPVIKKDGVALTESEYNNVTYSVKLKSDYALALAEYSKEVLSQFSVDEYQLIATYTSDDELDAKGAITKDGEFGQSDKIDFKITPKPITAQVEGTFKKPYDGNNTLPTATSADGSTTVPTITINKNDIVGDDEVSVSIVTDDPDYPYEFPEIDIDSYTIHLKLQLSGKDAYNYTLANVITEGGVKKTGFIEMDVTITKSKSSKPTNVTFVNGTICGKPDCSITGVTSAMEYSNDGGKTYTSITSTEITGLAAGTYLVRMAGNDTYIASDPVEGTLVNGSDQLKVTYNFNEESLQNKNTSVGVCFNESVTEPTDIPQYEGYKLVGWYSDKECSKANKYSFDTKVTDNITLYAKWVNEKDIIAIEFNGNVIYPTNTNDFCKGKDNTILLPYTITNGAPSDYKITFDSNLFSIIEGEVSEDHIINIPVPQNIVTGEYTGTIEFSNPSIDVSTTYPVKITATIPLRNAAVQLYTDMLIVDNHEGIYNAYQWYRNGEALPGATLLYYTEPKFDYNSLYTVKLSGDGKEMMSCPVEWLSTAKALKPSIKVYPNPAKQGEYFTLEILDFDEDQNYDIVIFTANGTMVKNISNVEQKTSVTLPSGVYSGSLINGGEKKGFKLIVK